ncbi:unnamed protein product [Rhizoctonia solani]|uniref:C2H2-type domain-containing protein n=1 Tax=Rhizoctonia solani TaxID=456999 RepID=A0A8H3E7H4_9AGAM|nr:unnamed protein product [Rhizoctonia solani]
MKTKSNANDTDPEKGNEGGFTLEKTIADMLLKGRAYFIHFPTVYCYDENRTIFRVGEGHRYQQVTSIGPNPSEPQVPFDIGGIKYAFDQTGVLWYNMGEYWLQEVTYSELSAALSVVVNCIEADNLHIANNPTHSPSSSDPRQSTSTESGMSYITMGTTEEGPQPLSSNPDQAEVDQWIEYMRQHRAMQVRDGLRLSAVRCPVAGCDATQRNPRALRDHLYLHFSIKPHRCDYGCAIAFETEAKKNRHVETCPLAAQLGTH